MNIKHLFILSFLLVINLSCHKSPKYTDEIISLMGTSHFIGCRKALMSIQEFGDQFQEITNQCFEASKKYEALLKELSNEKQ